MALNFPNNPANGDIYQALGRGWKYNSTASAWESLIRVNTAFDSDDITEGATNLYQNPENIQDEVNNLLQQGNNINLVYDDAANTMTISAVGSNTASDLLPDQNNVRDIGSTTLKWKDLHMAGIINSNDKVVVESAFAQTSLIGTFSLNANQYSGQPASVRFASQSNTMGSTLAVIGPGQTTNGRASFEIITYPNDGTTGNIRFTKGSDVLGEFHGDISGFDIIGQKLKIGDTTDTGATSTIEGSGTITIDPSTVGDNTGTVVIAGNLQVDGTTTTINSTTLDVDDLNITIASGAADSTAANGAGITVDGASATLTYSSTGDKWVFNKAPFYNTNALLTDIIQDTTPQLGGNLETNGNNIVGGNGDKIELISDGATPFIDVRGGSGPYIMRFRPGTNFTDTVGGVDIKYRTNPDDLLIERSENNNKIAEFGGDDGHAALYFDNAMKLETNTGGITVTGTLNTHTIPGGTGTIALTSDLSGYLQNVIDDTAPQLGGDLDTNGKDIIVTNQTSAILFNSASSQIYHNTTGNGTFTITSGDKISIDANALSGFAIENSANTQTFIDGSVNNPVNLYYQNSKKLETSNTGITVTGNVEATQQVISTIATGTAPLSVTSTTKVSNLNADLLDGKHASDINIEAIAFAIALG